MSTKLFFKRVSGSIRVLVDDIEKTVRLRHGDPLPENITAESLAKMHALGAVGESAKVTVLDAVEDKTPVATAAKDIKVDLSQLASMSEADIKALIEAGEGVSVKALTTAVGLDKELAQKVLAAETAATKGDPRKSLVTALEKIIGDAAAPAETEPETPAPAVETAVVGP